MKSFVGKVVVITGAGSGIGRALALNIAAKGAKLALSDVDETGLAETARLLGANKPRTDRLDVRDREAFAAYAASVAAEFGTVNVIINNAGVALTGNVGDMSYTDFEWIMDIDFWGVVNGTKEFLPHLIASGDGHIVNLSSLFGLLAIPGQSAYNSAKFAVRGFTESLRQEMLLGGHAVAVSAVHPGGIKTAIARNARAAEGENQAELAAYFDKKLAKTSATKAAAIIVKGILADKPKIVVGPDAIALDLMVKVLGAKYQNVVSRALKKAGPPKPVARTAAATPVVDRKVS